MDHEGTFPLPEAQLDRFLVRLSLGYPSAEEEAAMLSRLQHKHPIDDLQAVVSADEILQCQQAVRSIRVDEKVNRYIVELIRQSREHPDVLLGGSPRASLALYRSAQALAAIRGQCVHHARRHQAADARRPGAPDHPQAREPAAQGRPRSR